MGEYIFIRDPPTPMCVVYVCNISIFIHMYIYISIYISSIFFLYIHMYVCMYFENLVDAADQGELSVRVQLQVR